MYGEMSRDFCLLEVGSLCQLLETSAPTYSLSLCQTGHLDFARIRQFFLLEDTHLYLHALLAGPQASNKEAEIHTSPLHENEWEEGQI